MKKMLRMMLLPAILLTVLGLPAAAQTAEPQTAQTAPPQSYKVMIFEVKHRDPETLSKALDGLRSSGPNTAMVPNRQLKTITVRDYPENIAAISEAIKRLDVPEVTRIAELPSDIEFNLHLISASQTAGERTAFPAAIEPAVAQMRATLKFANYRYLTTITHRVNDNGRINSSGTISSPLPIQGKVNSSNYQYQVMQVRSIQDASGKNAFQLSRFAFTLTIAFETLGQIQYRDVNISTDLNLREGETAVVGTANVGSSDEAIILVVTAKKVK